MEASLAKKKFRLKQGTTGSPGPECVVLPLVEVSSLFLEEFQQRLGECGVGLYRGCQC